MQSRSFIALLCVVGYILLIPRCEANTDAIDIRKNLTYLEAALYCKNLNRTLPGPPDSEEYRDVLRGLNQSGLSRAWLGVKRVDMGYWSWSDDRAAIGVPPFLVLRGQNQRLKCAIVRRPVSTIYAADCGTKIHGYICKLDCYGCSKSSCFVYEGQCFEPICGRRIIDWYGAAKICETRLSGLATNISYEQSVNFKGACEEYWIGLTRERWRSGENYCKHGWLAGNHYGQERCVVASSTSGNLHWNLSDCASLSGVLCSFRSNTNVTVIGEEPSLQYRWIIALCIMCFTAVMALITALVVNTYRSRTTKRVHISPVDKSPRQHHLARQSGHQSTDSSTSNSLQSVVSSGTICSDCGQSNKDNNIHYENLLIAEVTRCFACGRLVKPQRPDKPRPGLPKRIQERSGVASGYHSPLASLKLQNDYENIDRGLRTIPIREIHVAKMLLENESHSSPESRKAKRRATSLTGSTDAVHGLNVQETSTSSSTHS